MADDLFAKFDSVVKEVGQWLETLGFGVKGRKGRGFELLYRNGWRLSFGFNTSQHNRRANEKYFFGLDAHLYDEDGQIRWWWSSMSDRPGRKRAQRDRRWHNTDPDSSPDEFRASLQSDLDAVTAAGGGWEALTHETDPASLV